MHNLTNLLKQYNTSSGYKKAEKENYTMWLNKEIQVGLDQAAQGKLVSWEKVRQDIKQLYLEQKIPK
ncbi:MAG TPA: transcriptional regulator [Rickettsia endosymbiont of Bembidion nr. Transversale]|nr:transcriptional regulator [Rickettsia endosymbiont of Bembidion nr. Transversale]